MLIGLSLGLILSHKRCLATHILWFLLGACFLGAILYLLAWKGFTGQSSYPCEGQFTLSENEREIDVANISSWHLEIRRLLKNSFAQCEQNIFSCISFRWVTRYTVSTCQKSYSNFESVFTVFLNSQKSFSISYGILFHQHC